MNTLPTFFGHKLTHQGLLYNLTCPVSAVLRVCVRSVPQQDSGALEMSQRHGQV